MVPVVEYPLVPANEIDCMMGSLPEAVTSSVFEAAIGVILSTGSSPNVFCGSERGWK